MKHLLSLFVALAVLMFATGGVSTAQTNLYTETFGSLVSPALPVGWTVTPNTVTWNTVNNANSSGYPGASGLSNLIGSNNGSATNSATYDNNLSTVGYSNITVLWGARRTSSFSNAITFEWSPDGTTWNPVTYTEVANDATWALVNGGVRIALPSGAAGIANLRLRWTYTQIGGSGNYRIDDLTVEGTSATVFDGAGTATLVNNAGTFSGSIIFNRNTGSQSVLLTVTGISSGNLDKVRVVVPSGWTGLSVGNITLGGAFAGKTPVVASNTITINSAALGTTPGTISIAGLTSANPVGALLNGNDTWIVQTAIVAGTLTNIAVSPKSVIIIPIQNIRTGGADGFGNTNAGGDTSAMNAQTVAISGVATVENQIISASSTQTSFFVQDGNYGVQVFRSGAPVTTWARGDVVVVHGFIDTFRGSTEVVPFSGSSPDFFNLGPGTLPTPSLLASAALISEQNEGKLVRVNSVSYDSAGRVFVATSSATPSLNTPNTFRKSPTDTGSVFLSTTNTIVGNTIPATGDIIGIVYHRNDIVGTGQPPHKIAPRDQVDLGQSLADGTGTGTIRPAARLSNQTAVAETLTVTPGAYTLTSVSVTIPASWSWNGSSRSLSGTGFSGAASAVTGDGSVGNPWVITVTGANLSGASTGSVNIQSLSTPSTLGATVFTVKTAGSGGTLTNIGVSPTVTIATAFEAAQSGNWSTPSTWAGGAVPGPSDDVSMSTLGVTVTIDIPNAQCNGLVMTGSGTLSNSGPVLQFQATGTPQLTINGSLLVSGGSGGGGGDRGGRPKLTSNGNAGATLVVKKTVYTTSSNSTTNGDAGVNMNEGTVKLTGSSADSLRNGAGLRLGNLQIGDGSTPKTIYTAPTQSATLTVRSLTVKQGSTFWIGTGSSTNVLTIGNSLVAGVPTLNGGIIVESGAALKVQESTAGLVVSTINLDGGGVTNNGTIDLVSPALTELTGCVYNLRVGGNPAGTSGVNQTIAGTAVGEFADVTIDSAHTLTLNQDMTVAAGHKLTIARGTLAETAGNTVVGATEATRTLAQSVNETFGGIGLEINAAGGAPGSTIVTRQTGIAVTSGSSASIQRWFDIVPTNNAGLNATMNFFYDNSELNGNNASVLKLYKSTNAGSSWADQGGTPNAGLRRVQLTGVQSFARFTAADTANPLGSATINVSLTAGWNMVSNPIITANDSVRQVFPTSTFPYAFAFVPASGYQQRYRLDHGVGYWAKFPSAGTASLGGTPRTLDSISVAAGWNMIGSIGVSVDTATIVTVPTGIRSTPYYGYPYSAVTTILPGKGYWVKASAPGVFVLAAGPAPARVAASRLESFGTVTISDGEGASQTLYLGEDADGSFPLAFYDMPPAGPEGTFDVRFATGRMVDTYSGKAEVPSVHTIDLRGLSQPVTVSWQLPAGSTRIFSLNDGSSSRRMQATGSMTLAHSTVRRLTISTTGGGLPTEFSLGQNYPNPFNPATSIRFGLPVESRVTVRVYNLLGQQVAELAQGVLGAGYHVVTWEGKTSIGASVGSGIYFCKLEAAALDGGRTFSDIRKMMLLK